MLIKPDVNPEAPDAATEPCSVPSTDVVASVGRPLPELPVSAEALALRLKELTQLHKSELCVINLRIDDAVTACLAASGRVQALLPRLRTLGSFKPELATALEEWAYVLNHVTTQANLEPARYRFSTALITEAKHLRRTLLLEANYLEAHGILCDSRIATVTKSKSFTHLANDLSRLVQIFEADRASWTGRCSLEMLQVDRARVVSELLNNALLEKMERAATDWVDLKIRAFTMLRRAHDEARASVMYLLRDQPGADRVIPPLTPLRTRTARRRRIRAHGTTPKPDMVISSVTRQTR